MATKSLRRQLRKARENAAKEIQEVKKKLESAKVEYSDEVASARENSTSEINRIRAETDKHIILLDHLNPAYNISKIFRSADAFGVREIHLSASTF